MTENLQTLEADACECDECEAVNGKQSNEVLAEPVNNWRGGMHPGLMVPPIANDVENDLARAYRRIEAGAVKEGLDLFDQALTELWPTWRTHGAW